MKFTCAECGQVFWSGPPMRKDGAVSCCTCACNTPQDEAANDMAYLRLLEAAYFELSTAARRIVRVAKDDLKYPVGERSEMRDAVRRLEEFCEEKL